MTYIIAFLPYIVAFILGFLLGWIKAAKKGGNTPDKLQYGTVFGMISMVLLLIALLIYAAVAN